MDLEKESTLIKVDTGKSKDLSELCARLLELQRQITRCEENIKELRRQARKTPRIDGAIARLSDTEGYIRMLTRYLRHGDWCSNFWGQDQEFKTQWKKIA